MILSSALKQERGVGGWGLGGVSIICLGRGIPVIDVLTRPCAAAQRPAAVLSQPAKDTTEVFRLIVWNLQICQTDLI